MANNMFSIQNSSSFRDYFDPNFDCSFGRLCFLKIQSQVGTTNPKIDRVNLKTLSNESIITL